MAWGTDFVTDEMAVSLVTPEDLTKLIADASEALRARADELDAIRAELQALAERTATPSSGVQTSASAIAAPVQAAVADRDTHANFLATGPGVGFLANAGRAFVESGTADGMFRGVVGIGSSGSQDQIAQTIGVLGFTADLDLFLADGTGVRGMTAGGVGVDGVSSSGGGTGVRGVSSDGPGVEGTSDTNVGVRGISQGVGVFGFGLIGAQCAGNQIGVLGGPPEGRAIPPANRIGAGVVGNAIGDLRAGDFAYSYGGWFDTLNGTSPIHLEPSASATPPAAAQRGDFFVDSAGGLWFCTNTGDNSPTRATWKTVQLA